MCACCVPYALGIGCILCVFAVCLALCAVVGSFFAFKCHAVPHLLCLYFIHKRFPRMRIRHNPLSYSSLLFSPGADYTVRVAFLSYHVYGNPNMSVLGYIVRVCVPAACPLYAVCSLCLLCVPYDPGFFFVLCVFAVSCVLFVASALPHSVTQSCTWSAFISHINSLPRILIRQHNFLSFSSSFLYPRADYTVSLAVPFQYVLGNHELFAVDGRSNGVSVDFHKIVNRDSGWL